MDVSDLHLTRYLSPSKTGWREFLLVAFVCYVLYFLFVVLPRRRRLRKLGSEAPVVPFWAPLGVDLVAKLIYRYYYNRFFEMTQDFLEVPGRTVELRMVGQRMVVTDSPENIKAILSSNFSNFGKGHVAHEVFRNMMGDVIFIVDDDLWHTSKDILRPHVSKSRPTDLEVTEKHIQQLFRHFRTTAGGTPVEVYDLIDRYQLDVVTNVFFGESANSLSTNRQPFRNAMDRLLKFNTLRFIFGSIATYISDRLVLRSSLKELDAYCQTLFDLAYSSDLSKKSDDDQTLLESLAARKLDFAGIRDQAMVFMLGGKDPAALIISWAIHHMAKDPALYQRLRAEIASVTGLLEPPTASQLKQLTYLGHVINETMRLYHPLGLNIKTAKADTSLPTGGGASGNEPVAILAGTPVMYSIMGLQRRKDIVGQDAECFRPERWETWTPNRWEFVPFNHGPRICLGRNFGAQQVEYVLARICQDFDEISLAEPEREQEIMLELNTKMAHPVLVNFVRRESVEKKGSD